MKRNFILFLAFMYLVTLCVEGVMVYCQSASGHVLVEKEHDHAHHCCQSEHDSDHHSKQDPCHPCFDMPVQLDDQVVSAGMRLPVSGLYVKSWIVFKDLWSTSLRIEPIDRPPPNIQTLEQLKTVILLI